MKIFYDTEFREDGRAIDLISIGMVAEDGREYYAIFDDFHTLTAAVEHPWLREHVVPSLPIITCPHSADPWYFDEEHADYPAVKIRHTIASEVREFILAGSGPDLWAWHAAYDHVALAQLWGPMIRLPEGVPRWTNDLKQECERLGNPRMPEQAEGEHNALAGARHVKLMHDFLASLRETP
jgi:hypothetical protein